MTILLKAIDRRLKSMFLKACVLPNTFFLNFIDGEEMLGRDQGSNLVCRTKGSGHLYGMYRENKVLPREKVRK